MKNRSALVLAVCLFTLVLAMCLYSAPRLAREASAYIQAAPVVVIDAGHGGEDGGASSPDGVLESGLNLQFALRMRDLLQFAGVETVMLRETNTALYTDGCSGIAEKKVSACGKTRRAAPAPPLAAAPFAGQPCRDGAVTRFCISRHFRTQIIVVLRALSRRFARPRAYNSCRTKAERADGRWAAGAASVFSSP